MDRWGVDAKTVQTWVGHTSIQETFDTYGHLFAEAKLDRAAAVAIEDELAIWFDTANRQQSA